MPPSALRQGSKMLIKLPDKVHDGYSYYTYRSNDDKNYVRCHSRTVNKCPAIGKLVNGVPLLSKDHNHAKNPLLSCQHQFQKVLYKVATDRPFQSLRLAYDTQCLLHSEAAVTLTWTKMQQVMQRWRSQVTPQHPEQPRNLIDYERLLQQLEWQHLICYNNGILRVQTVQAADTSYITIIGDPNFLTLINPKTLFMDATYKIKPKKPKIYQIFMITGLVYDTAVPVCCMIMTAKSTSAYTAGLTHFKEEFAPHFQPDVIMTDFETSLPDSIRSVYPQAKHVGCLFHYCQAVMKKFKEFKLLELSKQWLPGQIIMRKVMALALLPHHEIIPAFHWLQANLPVDIRQIFTPFLRYFRRQWINRVPPSRYSVFNEKNRTNNFSESNNRRNKQRFGIHPNIWTFTEKLRDLQAVTHIEILSLFRGETIARDSRSNTVKRDQDIKNAWLLYEQGLLNMQNFLAYASLFLKPTYLEIEIEHMDLRRDDEDDIIVFGEMVLQPAEYYLAMDVFQEIDIQFE